MVDDSSVDDSNEYDNPPADEQNSSTTSNQGGSQNPLSNQRIRQAQQTKGLSPKRKLTDLTRAPRKAPVAKLPKLDRESERDLDRRRPAKRVAQGLGGMGQEAIKQGGKAAATRRTPLDTATDVETAREAHKAYKWGRKKFFNKGAQKGAAKVAEKEAAKLATKTAPKIATKLGTRVVPKAISKAVPKATARLAAKAAEEATAKLAAKAATKIFGKLLIKKTLLAGVKFIPYIGAIVIITGGIYLAYTGGRNKMNSLMGGSIFMAASYDNQEDRDLVVDLEQKNAGMVPGHVLKIHHPNIVGINLIRFDISWQLDEDTGQWTHPLDIRILKTLKYLTDKHEYVEIGMLKTNAPTLLRESLRVKKAGQEYETIAKESFSAFYLGQGMAITAVDYSKIEDLPPKTPIEINWQKTITEKIARPIWEELNFIAGYLDGNVDAYKESAVLEFGDPAMQDTVGAYKSALGDIEYSDLYEQTFIKIDRILELLGRVDTFIESKGNALDDRTKNYFDATKNRFNSLQFSVGYLNSDSSDAGLERRIRGMGSTENIKWLRDGIRYIYKATQVANMVDWNEKGLSNLKWNQAFEARNKIRQVIKELLEMPREVLEPAVPGEVASNFNPFMVVKQIVTFSPEDDLDNGLMDLDVFPKGITAVDVGGVAFEGTGTVEEKDSNGNVVAGHTIGDGVIDYADMQFSYKPMDDGVFSKAGTNYIWVFDPDKKDEWLARAEVLLSALKNFVVDIPLLLHNYFVGGCIYDPDFEECKPITYRGFLHVSF